MTLEEYRLRVIGQLKASEDPERALGVLALADLVLANGRFSQHSQKLFWEALNKDLDVLAQESTQLLQREAATALDAVIVAARTVIPQYQMLLASEEERAGC